ncbi:argininosuccinate synthase [Methanofollis formosanus]|uniref:Argininosuccinate synthase n=1 Tax=Methanofollis formosanus TaxID=299308 RepID=A0A8G1A1R0_9EURY|nr:argininosuccinate synthase [Methanofollis formosanus]QYZ78492.1 argininosuccinate synthase [Methanofollis formosanus]
MRDHGVLKAVGLVLALLVFMIPAAAATTEVHVVKYAPDGKTVLDERTVDYIWMEKNLPVLGDGVTHYYHQGPTFNESDKWDPAEYQNVDTRDYGAVKGTAVSALCDLVGGMAPGDILKVKAEDGFYKKFSYESVYEENPQKGTMGLAWYVGEDSLTGDPQGSGYVPDYYDGMRLIFFADTSTNPWGWHVFGDNDMKETLPEDEWHFFSGDWPSTSGLSVKQVGELAITAHDTGSDAGSVPTTTAARSPLGPLAGLLALCAVAVLRR